MPTTGTPPPDAFPPPSPPPSVSTPPPVSLDGTGSVHDTEDSRDAEDPQDADDPQISSDPQVPQHLRTSEHQRTAQAAFEAFFEGHHRELARLAFLLTGNKEDAEDITADALTSAWMHWDRVQAAENSLAYVRRSVANLAASQVRRHIRQRNLLAKVGRQPENPATREPDVPQALLLQWALDQLPHRKRQCVVLRYGLDLSEAETADWLGVSVGTVKSQTSKAVSELERLLTAGGSGAGAPSDGGGRHQRHPSRPGGRGSSRKVAGRGRQGRAGAPSEPTRTAFMWLRGGEA
ncbi:MULTISPECIES: SigE family RNA polymerase sigma factor [unclassified Pseudofrankia]|uniref:SigE family RNA polymerase sigma factor n=1 Tax=unclassified Pseudofrankia TaxID=2994372 RepID=UPI001F52A1AA|nr:MULTISPECIES: SigE family RNA polymerase sigma factor [unclassified Pseudofrankia]MDT3441815.1 SigE family RNA polymerase sigma factor [Pseudofrankia sp. BMG5.37]